MNHGTEGGISCPMLIAHMHTLLHNKWKLTCSSLVLNESVLGYHNLARICIRVGICTWPVTPKQVMLSKNPTYPTENQSYLY